MTHQFPYRIAAILFVLLFFISFLPIPIARAASLVVTTSVDNTDTNDNLCSLREAILNANNNNANNNDCVAGSNAQVDVITFDPSITNITLSSALPAITDPKGLTIDGGGTVTISGNNTYRVFQNNAVLTINALTIANGNAVSLSPSRGGGIYNNGGTLTVTNSRFVNNQSTFGGGIHSLNGQVSVSRTVFEQNTALSGGGGMILIGASSGAHTVSESLFLDNIAYNPANQYGTGGGIQAQDSITLVVTNTTFFNNQANGSADDGGGGIMVYGGTVTVINSTFSENSAATQGGGVHRLNGTLTLRNTIIANSTHGGNCAGSVVDGSGNLVWGDTTCPGANLDPHLQPLADNGGPSQTMALGAGSDAINLALSANCPATDQRGFNRRNGYCDSGAFEAQAAQITAASGTPQVAVRNYPFNDPLVAQVRDEFGNLLAGAEVTYTAPASGASASLSAPAPTDLNGETSVTASANEIAGAYTVTASSGAATPAFFELTNVEPMVNAITATGANPTNAASVDFTVSFNVPVAGVDLTDFTLTIGGGISGADLVSVAGSGALYTVTVNTGSGDGSIRLDLNDDDSISDTIYHQPLGGAGIGNGNFTGGDTYSIDKTAPIASVTSGPPLLTTSTNAEFTYESNEPNSAFECILDGAAFNACPAAYTNLNDGEHTFQVRAIDLAGNTGPAANPYIWTIDTTPPTLNLPEDITAEATGPGGAVVYFTVTASDLIDPSPQVSCAPASGTIFPLGVTPVECTATDAAGNQAYGSFNVTVQDTTPPETTLESIDPAASPTNVTSMQIVFSSNEAGSTFQCQLDGGGYTPCTSPVNLVNLPDGAHQFEVFATDPSNNPDPTPASYQWVVDTIPPTLIITSAPPALSNSNFASFSLQSSDPNSTFECSLDGAAFAPCANPAGYTDLLDGDHLFVARAIDLAGNIGAPCDPYPWTIDTVPPETSITASPANPTNSTAASFSFESNEPGSAFQCSLDGAAFSPCNSPDMYTNLLEGDHTFAVYAVDLAGNADASSAAYNWTVDLTAPETTLTAFPDNPTASPAASFSFESNEPGSNFECSLDGAGFAPCTSPAEYSALGDGEHQFAVRAVDLASNTDLLPATYTWFVDTQPPTVTLVSNPANPVASVNADFSFTVSDSGAGVDTITCWLDGEAPADCPAGTFSAIVAEGNHTFYVQATDLAGNIQLFSYTWLVDLTPPTAQVTALATFQSSLVFTVNWSGEDALTSIKAFDVQVQVDGGEWNDWLTNTPLTQASYTGEDSRTYAFRARATDQVENQGDWSSANATILDVTAPVAAMEALEQISEATFTVSWSGSDATSGVASYDVQVQVNEGGWNDWLLSTTSLSADYTGSSGQRLEFRVRARDQAGNAGEWSQAVSTTIGIHIYLPSILR